MSAISAQAAIQQVTDTLYAPFRYTGAGLPEGVQTSEPGWIYRDTNTGQLWFKKTGSAATGWKAMPGLIALDTTATANVGAGEDLLQTYTLPAGMLKDNGDSLRITIGGAFAANANAKLVYLLFGGTYVFTGVGNANANMWKAVIDVVRVSASSQKVVCSWNMGYVSGAGAAAYYATAAIDLTAAVTVLVNGTGVADNDIVKQIFQVEMLPSPT